MHKKQLAEAVRVKKPAGLTWQVDLRNFNCEFMRCPHAKLMGMGVGGVWTLQISEHYNSSFIGNNFHTTLNSKRKVY
jgi:hypothetical protein